jgi:hypothetical protein
VLEESPEEVEEEAVELEASDEPDELAAGVLALEPAELSAPGLVDE